MKNFVRFFQIGLASILATLWISSTEIAPATAHWDDLAVADVLVGTTEAQITLTVPTALLAFADDNGDKTLSPIEVKAQSSQLEEYLGNRITLTNQRAEPGMVTVTSGVAMQSQGKPAQSTLILSYRWITPLQKLAIRYGLFSTELDQVQCLATITQGDSTRNVVFTPDNNTIEISGEIPWQQQFLSFLKLGIKHIFTGYDHILFLVALLLPGTHISQLLKIVTAFTIAHSITLTLAVLNIVTLPTALVESIIALSIVYVAAENLWKKQLNHRSWLTFGFGLIHGLGFANILRDITQSQDNLFLSLVSFNLGVEVGQITIVLLVFYGLRLWQNQRGAVVLKYGISCLTIVMGGIWFAERALAVGL